MLVVMQTGDSAHNTYKASLAPWKTFLINSTINNISPIPTHHFKMQFTTLLSVIAVLATTSAAPIAVAE
jgi:hypothetical protein